MEQQRFAVWHMWSNGEPCASSGKQRRGNTFIEENRKLAEVFQTASSSGSDHDTRRAWQLPLQALPNPIQMRFVPIKLHRLSLIEFSFLRFFAYSCYCSLILDPFIGYMCSKNLLLVCVFPFALCYPWIKINLSEFFFFCVGERKNNNLIMVIISQCYVY